MYYKLPLKFAITFNR